MTDKSRDQPDLATVGGRIRWAVEVRKRMGPAEFARLIGKKPQLLSRWMNDPDKSPNRESIRLIAETTGVPPAWLEYGGKPPEEETEAGADRPLMVREGRRTLGEPDEEAKSYARHGASQAEESPTKDDRALFDEVMGILRSQEIPPGLRVLLIDAATSAWTKAALYRGEVASEERARAVYQAEVTQAARTEAIREVERHATDRFHALRGEPAAGTGAPILPLNDPPGSGGGGKKKESA